MDRFEGSLNYVFFGDHDQTMHIKMAILREFPKIKVPEVSVGVL